VSRKLPKSPYGSTEAAKKITIQIAESNSGIPADVKSWLKAGGVIKKTRNSVFVEETKQIEADQLIAQLIIEAAQLTEPLLSVNNHLLPTIQML
jgi:hypothetical protein